MPETQIKGHDIESTSLESKISNDIDFTKVETDRINLTSVNPSDTATFFGTDDSGNSTLHMRIGNGSGDKIQIESWNGSAATSLMEVGQTTVTIKGDLVVSGTTTTVNSETLEVGDNYIILNSGVTGSPTLDAGIRVERGSEADVEFKWNETEDKWEADSGLIVSGNIRTAVGSGLSDADGDTYITVEETADDDTIHFYAGGSEVEVSDSNLTILNTGSSSGEIYLSANVNSSNQNSDSPRLNFIGRGQTAGFGIQAINVTGYGKKDLVFYAHNSSDYTTYYEVMRIKYNGNVGIGTPTPETQLELKDGSGLKIIASNARIMMADITGTMYIRMDNAGNMEITDGSLSPNVHFDKTGYVRINKGQSLKLVDGTGTYTTTMYQSSGSTGNLHIDAGRNRVYLNWYPTSGNGDAVTGNGSENYGVHYASEFHVSSDRKLKTDIADYDKSAIDIVKNLKVKKYKMVNDNHKREHIGLIAQDIQTVMPEIVEEVLDLDKGTTTLTHSLNDLIFLNIKAIQELEEKINDLQQQIDSMK